MDLYSIIKVHECLHIHHLVKPKTPNIYTKFNIKIIKKIVYATRTCLYSSSINRLHEP